MAEFETLATKQRSMLANQAVRNIKSKYRGDVEDVIQIALMATWEHRDSIHGSVKQYLMGIIKRIAFKWEAPGGKHQGAKQPDYCQLDDELTVLIDRRPSALELLCDETRSIEELEVVVPILSWAKQKTYEELKSRGYVPGKGHAWNCRMSKLRNAFRKEVEKAQAKKLAA